MAGAAPPAESSFAPSGLHTSHGTALGTCSDHKRAGVPIQDQTSTEASARIKPSRSPLGSNLRKTGALDAAGKNSRLLEERFCRNNPSAGTKAAMRSLPG